MPSCPTSTCTWNRVAGTQNPIAAAPTPAIRVFSTAGSVASTPDLLFQPIVTRPAPVTSIELSDVTSANVHAVPVSLTLPAGDVGAHLAFHGVTGFGRSQSGPAFDVAAVNGQISTTVDASALEDGHLVVFAVPFDRYGNLGTTSENAEATKEAISLTPTGYDPSDTEVRAQPLVTVDFNEGLQSDSALSMTTADGKPVAGDSLTSGDTVDLDTLNTPTKLPSGSTVTLTVHAYASTCAAGQTSTCDDQFSRTWTATVDTTPPLAPVNVRCSPGVVDPSSGLLTVAGESAAGDGVMVTAIGMKTDTQISRTIGASQPGKSRGLTHWSTTLDLRHHAVGNYRVVADDIDPAGNEGSSSAAVYCGLGTPAAVSLAGLPKNHIVRAGKTFTVSGRLTSAGPAPTPLAGRIIRIRQFRHPRFDPGRKYTPLRTVRTDADGVWHGTVRLVHSGYLQA